MIQPQVLRYFAEVARTGSLRQASEVFFVAPSAIGKQIGKPREGAGYGAVRSFTARHGVDGGGPCLARVRCRERGPYRPSSLGHRRSQRDAPWHRTDRIGRSGRSEHRARHPDRALARVSRHPLPPGSLRHRPHRRGADPSVRRHRHGFQPVHRERTERERWDAEFSEGRDDEWRTLLHAVPKDGSDSVTEVRRS